MAIALLTVNKHWAALVFHGYTLVRVLSEYGKSKPPISAMERL